MARALSQSQRELDRPPSDYGRGAAPKRWLWRSAASGLAALALTVGVVAALRAARNGRARASDATAPPERAARLLREGAAILASSVFVDSALEHYRGRFQNPVMWVAPSVSAATLLHSLGAGRRAARGLTVGLVTPLLALLTGLLGAGFHVRNITARPGGLKGPRGLRWVNVFYAAPLGAPLALSLAGAFGIAARSVTRVLPASAHVGRGRQLGALTSAALLGTTAEVWQLHFRGAFQNPFMYVPVSLPVVAALALATHSYAPRTTGHASNALLAATALMGMAGVGFHAYGLQRNMGGVANFRQNILAGPPLPAPPAFSGVALAGLGALELMRSKS